MANARQAEVAAISAYAQAKLQLDQATGTILENNNVIIDEVKNGRLSKTPSPIPDVPPHYERPGRAAITTPGVNSAGRKSIIRRRAACSHFGNSFHAGDALAARSGAATLSLFHQ